MLDTSSLRFLYSSSFALLLPSLISLVFACCKLTCALDTLLPGQFLNANQSLISKNGAFKLGYDCSITQDYYCGLGIWFAKPSSCNREYFPLWQPDRYSYDGSSFILSVSENGVLNYTIAGYNVWSTPGTRTTSISTIVVLHDNGNLVIRDQSNISRVLWQSFDSPTDTLLSGGRLGYNGDGACNRYLTSFVDLIYSLQLDSTRRKGFIITYPGNYSNFGTFPTWVDIREEDGSGVLTFNDALTYMRLDAEYGSVKIAKLGECDSILWSMPGSFCGLRKKNGSFSRVGSYCGPYGLCTRSGSCMCADDGFEKGSRNYEGCLRKEPLNCESSSAEQELMFYPVSNVHRFPDNSFSIEIERMKECEAYCSRNCTCTSFVYNVTCLLWYQELTNTVLLDSGLSGNSIFLRIATKQQKPGSTALKEVIVPLMLGMLALIAIGSILLRRCIRKLLKGRVVVENGKLLKGRVVVENGTLTVFSFAQIKTSTKRFSEKLGEGGFGSVFKGMLPGFTVVAIKKLKGLRQGDKQFRAEVQTIGMIQHINIVRLIGFCAEDSGRFLVYEYMVNGSLSNHLFSKSPSKLSWEVRYSIALGIARGLAYLHEGCKDCIVHCDLKPDNVLLDAELLPLSRFKCRRSCVPGACSML